MSEYELRAVVTVRTESKLSLPEDTQKYIDSIIKVSAVDDIAGDTVLTRVPECSAPEDSCAEIDPPAERLGGSEPQSAVYAIDSRQPAPNDGNMSNPSREEFELRFQLLDQRLESSLDRSNDRVANLLDSQQRLQERLERQIESIATLNASARVDFARDIKAAEKDIAEKLESSNNESQRRLQERLERQIESITNLNAAARIDFAKDLKSAEKGIVDRVENSNKTTVDQIKAENKSMKSTMIITAIGTALTIVIGVAAFNSTVLSNMVASFETGKSVAAELAKSSAELNEVSKRQTDSDKKREDEGQTEINDSASHKVSPHGKASGSAPER